MSGRKRLELTALFGLGIQIAFLCVVFVLHAASRSGAVFVEMCHLAPGMLVWFVVLFHGRQLRLAAEEEEELRELKKTRLSEELFEETELDSMRAKSGLIIFERYLVPALSILLSASLLLLAYFAMGRTWPSEKAVEARNIAPVAVGMVFLTFVGFLVGRYAAVMAQNPRYRLLRACAGYMLGNVAGCLLVVVALGAAYFHVLWPEWVVIRLIPVAMAVVGVEIIMNLILDIYRPRVEGQPARPPYDSRLLGLFAEPAGVLKTVAATLDYQFGFKVSETWFYRFMQRAIVPLLAIQLFTLWLLTSIVVVDRHEVAFIERFGRPRVRKEDAAKGLQASIYGPGYYLKLPWPFDAARYIPAYQLQRFEIGKVYYREGEEHGETQQKGRLMTDPDIILWTEEHIDPEIGYEPNLLAPSFEKLSQPGAEDEEPVPEINLARVLGYVHFRIKRQADGSVAPQAAYDYYYRHTDSRRLVEHLAYSVLCRLAAHQNFLRWVNVEREAFNLRFREELQKVIDEHRLGVEVVMAGIPVVHSPPQVADAYRDVINAYEEREAMIYEGQAEAIAAVEEGKAEAAKIVKAAESYAYRVKALAEADANRFLVQLSAYRKSPGVYKYRKYLSTLEEVLAAGHRLYVMPVGRDEVQIIDLQEKIRPELLDFDVEEVVK